MNGRSSKSVVPQKVCAVPSQSKAEALFRPPTKEKTGNLLYVRNPSKVVLKTWIIHHLYYVLDEDSQPVIRAIGVSHTHPCKDEFRRNLRSHSWSRFFFFHFSLANYRERGGVKGSHTSMLGYFL